MQTASNASGCREPTNSVYVTDLQHRGARLSESKGATPTMCSRMTAVLQLSKSNLLMARKRNKLCHLSPRPYPPGHCYCTTMEDRVWPDWPGLPVCVECNGVTSCFHNLLTANTYSCNLIGLPTFQQRLVIAVSTRPIHLCRHWFHAKTQYKVNVPYRGLHNGCLGSVIMQSLALP